MLVTACRTPTGRDLLRLLCCWLAVLTALQGLSASYWRGQGPFHWHPAHAGLGMVDAYAHDHAHDQGQRHHHGADDVVGVQALPDPAAEAAGALLAAASAQLNAGWAGLGEVGPPWRPRRPPVEGEALWRSHLCAPPLTPPRSA